jgi:YVTN family beta-propeller protein
VAAAADGRRVLVGGGGDDASYLYEAGAQGFELASRVPFGLKAEMGLGGLGRNSGPFVGEVAFASGDAKAVAVLHGNDALAFVTLPAIGTKSASKSKAPAPRLVSLRPGRGVAGGEAPYALAVCGDRAYVASLRDDEIVAVDTKAEAVVGRVHVGALPVALAITRDCTTLAVAESNGDAVSFVDAPNLALRKRVPVGLHDKLRLASPNALAFSSDEHDLLVSLGGANAVARIDLAGGVASAHVRGLIPTGYYPMTVLHDGASMIVGTAKTAGGPNPLGPWSLPSVAGKNPYTLGKGVGFSLQQEEATVFTHPLPKDENLEITLTNVVRDNARLDVLTEPMPALFTDLRRKVRHVIYVIGENRTFDQLFADVDRVDGDKNLLLWGRDLSPNQHALADAVTLDHFFVSGDVSGQGWPWSTSARTNDWLERAIPAEYAPRGKYPYNWEGTNRGINVGLPTNADRRAWNPASPDDDDLLPGVHDFGAVEAAEEGGAGFLWDEALRHGLTVRNYGFFCDDSRYFVKPDDPVYLSPELREPWKTGTRVAFPARSSLRDRTDPYFRCYDQKFPDVHRVRSWEREFDGYVAGHDLPALSLVRLSHDHFGNFDKAVDGVDTPDTQMADHDYAIGLLVERVAASEYWDDTLIVVTEDDAQNGSDHVHSHRSFVLFAGGPVAQGVRSSTRYTTPSVLRTVELVLGLDPLAIPDAVAPPIVEAFDLSRTAPRFKALVPAVLRSTKLALPAAQDGKTQLSAAPRGTAAVWAARTVGFDFDEADQVPSWAFERLLSGHLGGRAAR